ncbi:MAG: bifunctional pyr operon transcriptional regulator/uracil phosphoribosyltransferase PyrR [Balneolales bacterium]|nr:bifunctional pyr operon transcriptional regulator/uracil phosphoribosyltransferase PyrR [Balneolales bacterium]
MDPSAKLLDETDLKRIIERFAYQFTEPYDNLSSFAIIGMQRRGVFIARRIRKFLKEKTGVNVDMGVLDITFYRDDFRDSMKMPEVQITDIPFDLYGKNVVLVDDVLYTGRTARAALEALMSFGRPASVRFCCLIDRGHRELPILADYTGKYVPTHVNEEVMVKLYEMDGEDAVYVVSRNGRTDHEG